MSPPSGGWWLLPLLPLGRSGQRLPLREEERRRKANIKISNSAMVKLGEELVSGIGNGSGEVRTLYT